MSDSSSPAHPSQASTATTTPTVALQGTTTTASSAGSVNNAAFSLDDFNFPVDVLTAQDHKDEALRAMKSDLMAALNKEMKSLDEDAWMFEGPRSRINVIARPGGFFSTKSNQISNLWQAALPR